MVILEALRSALRSKATLISRLDLVRKSKRNISMWNMRIMEDAEDAEETVAEVIVAEVIGAEVTVVEVAEETEDVAETAEVDVVDAVDVEDTEDMKTAVNIENMKEVVERKASRIKTTLLETGKRKMVET